MQPFTARLDMDGFMTFDEVEPGMPSSLGVNVSVVARMMECWCLANLQWVRDQCNQCASIWEGVVRHMRGYLIALWVSCMLKGKTAGQAFVHRDDTTMSEVILPTVC